MSDFETFHGLVETTSDALRIFELCRHGRLGRVRRRLHERERRQIKSGSIFVFDEAESGIRRWTDGRLWSPSRILGNFLVYRELERRQLDDNDLLNENAKNGSGSLGSSSHNSVTVDSNFSNLNHNAKRSHHDETDSWSSSGGNYSRNYLTDGRFSEGSLENGKKSSIFTEKDLKKPKQMVPTCTAASLLGPNAFRLLKSKKLQRSGNKDQQTPPRFKFKDGSLFKKTISARIDGRLQHLISYFSETDFLWTHCRPLERVSLPTPEAAKTMIALREKVSIPADLAMQQQFRRPPTSEGFEDLADLSSNPFSGASFESGEMLIRDSNASKFINGHLLYENSGLKKFLNGNLTEQSDATKFMSSDGDLLLSAGFNSKEINSGLLLGNGHIDDRYDISPRLDTAASRKICTSKINGKSRAVSVEDTITEYVGHRPSMDSPGRFKKTGLFCDFPEKKQEDLENNMSLPDLSQEHKNMSEYLTSRTNDGGGDLLDFDQKIFKLDDHTSNLDGNHQLKLNDHRIFDKKTYLEFSGSGILETSQIDSCQDEALHALLLGTEDQNNQHQNTILSAPSEDLIGNYMLRADDPLLPVVHRPDSAFAD